MGTAKRAAEEKKSSARKRIAERRAAQAKRIEDTWLDMYGDLAEAMLDDMNPLLDLRVKIRDDGSYLGLAKRENDIKEEVIFFVAESVLGAFLGLNKKIKAGAWKESVPWNKNKD